MTYEYRCDKCNSNLVIDKSMSDSSRKEFCKECKNKLTRIFSIPSISTSDGFKK